MHELVHEVVIPVIRDLASRGALPRELTQQPLDADTDIDSLGMDSLGKLNLLSELEERADVTLNERHIVGLRTLGDLAALLTRLRG